MKRHRLTIHVTFGPDPEPSDREYLLHGVNEAAGDIGARVELEPVVLVRICNECSAEEPTSGWKERWIDGGDWHVCPGCAEAWRWESERRLSAEIEARIVAGDETP